MFCIRKSLFSDRINLVSHLKLFEACVGISLSHALLHLRLWRSVRASGIQLSPYFINWDSYFNSFWEPLLSIFYLNFVGYERVILNILVSFLNLLELFHMLLVIYLRKLAKLCFVDRCLSFCPFSSGHCVVFFFNIRIMITLWYRQTLLEQFNVSLLKGNNITKFPIYEI
jgi:hypothetical protein